MRILVVDDETVLADAIADGLRRASYAVDIAYDGAGALERLSVNAYDVLVLDRDLPGISGDQVCRTVVASGAPVRILMVTAAGDLADRVYGLDLGADDYLAKPFAFAELLARVRALARRVRPADRPTLSRAGITLDPARRDVARDGNPIALSRREFAVLEELLRADGAAVTSEELLEKVWDEHIDPFTNVLRVTVMSLRRKLGEPTLVATVTGVGYQIR